VAAGALYVESFGNALKFARTARRFAERKPLLAVAGGAAASQGVTALFAQAGVIPCRGAADIAEAAAVLTQQPLPGGFRVAVVTNAGGMGVLAAGMASGEGLSVRRCLRVCSPRWPRPRRWSAPGTPSTSVRM
jgi:acyl-CoA synthetase (NDP forming)